MEDLTEAQATNSLSLPGKLLMPIPATPGAVTLPKDRMAISECRTPYALAKAEASKSLSLPGKLKDRDEPQGRLAYRGKLGDLRLDQGQFPATR